MIDSLCTTIYQPLEIIEGSTFDVLIKLYPEAAFHDKVNRLFNAIDEDAINPIIVSDLKDEDGEELTGDALVAALGPILFADDRERAIHIRKSVLSELYKHPVYRLYCGNYETIVDHEVDYKLVFKTSHGRSKNLDYLNEKSRINLKAALGGE